MPLRVGYVVGVGFILIWCVCVCGCVCVCCQMFDLVANLYDMVVGLDVWGSRVWFL